MTLVQQNKGTWGVATGRTIVSPGGSKIRRSALLRALERGDVATAEKFVVAVAEREIVPEGKRAVGSDRIEVVDGKPVIVRDLEDKPAPQPDTRTVEEKIAESAGVTVEELRGVLRAEKTSEAVR